MSENAYIKGDNQKPPVVSDGQFERLLDLFLKGLEALKYSPRTVETRRISLRAFFYFLAVEGTVSLQEVTSDDIEKYRLSLVRRKLSGPTVGGYLGSVRMFFRFLEESGEVFASPAKDLVIPRGESVLIEVPTPKDMKKLLAAPDAASRFGIRDRAMIELLYSTAVRRSEFLNLDIFSVDMRNRVVNVREGKGGKDRVVPLGGHAAFWLERYLSGPRSELLGDRIDERALWITSAGARFGDVRLMRMLDKYSETAGIRRVRPHDIRRACATHMLQNGAHPVQVQMLLGHADIGTLRHYLKLTVDDVRRMHKRSKAGE